MIWWEISNAFHGIINMVFWCIGPQFYSVVYYVICHHVSLGAQTAIKVDWRIFIVKNIVCFCCKDQMLFVWDLIKTQDPTKWKGLMMSQNLICWKMISSFLFSQTAEEKKKRSTGGFVERFLSSCLINKNSHAASSNAMHEKPWAWNCDYSPVWR